MQLLSSKECALVKLNKGLKGGAEKVHGFPQIPRLYDIYKAQGLVDNFEQLLDNIFTPLFEVTVDPNSHPQLHLFLKQVNFQTTHTSNVARRLSRRCD